MNKTDKQNGKSSEQIDGDDDESTPLNYLVNRNVIQYDEFTQISGYKRQKPTYMDTIKASAREFKCTRLIKDTIPVVDWLPKYSLRNDFMGDLMAGVTVAVMHIPQGMAYGILAGLTPSVGLYLAFFPTLVYFIFGTSRHISTGTFAVISIMVSKIVNTYATINTTNTETMISNMNNATGESHVEGYTPFQVATAVTMVTGLFHLVMYAFRLGTLASLLSKPMVNAFTTAAAVHVLVTQFKDLLGLDVPRHKGAFKILLTMFDIFRKLHEFNAVTVYISICVMIFMIFMNEYVKPKMSKVCKFPIPAELIAVVGANVISMLMEWGPRHGVRLIGAIPLGLPAPEMPPLELLRTVALDSIAVTIVSISIAISMAFIFAHKQGYDVNPNQELLAFGLSNIVGSFFSCIPLAASLSRSVIQEQTGGKTQIASVISAGLILILLLWVGPFFETLPKCVLSGIIIVALKSMFWQVKDLRRFAEQSKLEAAVWLVTFLGVVLIDIDIGLLAGIAVSLAVLYIKGYKSYHFVLGAVNGTDIYVDIDTHKNATEIPHLKIFRYCGAINFASKGTFKKAINDATKVDHRLIRRASSIVDKSESTKLFGLRSVILDLSTVPHMDYSGCEVLSEVQKELALLGATLYLTGPRDNVYDTLIHSQILGEGPFNTMPTIHDAVCQHNKLLDVVTT